MLHGAHRSCGASCPPLSRTVQASAPGRPLSREPRFLVSAATTALQPTQAVSAFDATSLSRLRHVVKVRTVSIDNYGCRAHHLAHLPLQCVCADKYVGHCFTLRPSPYLCLPLLIGRVQGVLGVAAVGILAGGAMVVGQPAAPVQWVSALWVVLLLLSIAAAVLLGGGSGASAAAVPTPELLLFTLSQCPLWPALLHSSCYCYCCHRHPCYPTPVTHTYPSLPSHITLCALHGAWHVRHAWLRSTLRSPTPCLLQGMLEPLLARSLGLSLQAWALTTHQALALGVAVFQFMLTAAGPLISLGDRNRPPATHTPATFPAAAAAAPPSSKPPSPSHPSDGSAGSHGGAYSAGGCPPPAPTAAQSPPSLTSSRADPPTPASQQQQQQTQQEATPATTHDAPTTETQPVIPGLRGSGSSRGLAPGNSTAPEPAPQSTANVSSGAGLTPPGARPGRAGAGRAMPGSNLVGSGEVVAGQATPTTTQEDVVGRGRGRARAAAVPPAPEAMEARLGGLQVEGADALGQRQAGALVPAGSSHGSSAGERVQVAARGGVQALLQALGRSAAMQALLHVLPASLSRKVGGHDYGSTSRGDIRGGEGAERDNASFAGFLSPAVLTSGGLSGTVVYDRVECDEADDFALPAHDDMMVSPTATLDD
uniref:Uncharacterized protein n=1 Tax=Haematococcus lacustris TaxID=44745 RepID=A0A6A0AC01_HAELA